MLISFYAAPRPTCGFYPVMLRNLLVWRKLAVPSVLGNIAEPLITLVAFGYGLGSMIGRVDGLPYITYLASGTIAVSNKTLDFDRDFYKATSPQRVRSRLKKMVDDVANWKQTREYPRPYLPEVRRLHILVPSGRTTPGQASQLAAARAYAKSRGVVLTIRHGR